MGLAFHPDYAENGRFFVNYTRGDGDTVIAEYAVSEDANSADPASERILLTIPQPYPNHNGGDLAFGPDGYLYIGMGDGGAGGDPEGNGQDPDTLLGAMLRIDVDNGEPYSVPQDNPFASAEGAAPEVWATASATPGGFRSTVKPATCGSPTWDKMRLKRSICKAPTARVAKLRLEHHRRRKLF